MDVEIVKECTEEIGICLRCKNLITFEEGEKVVRIKCLAEDRFDCPRLRAFYSEEELRKVDAWKARTRQQK